MEPRDHIWNILNRILHAAAAVRLRSHDDDDAHAEKTSQKYSMQIGIFINFVCQKKIFISMGPKKKFTCELLQRCRIGNTKKKYKNRTS